MFILSKQVNTGLPGSNPLESNAKCGYFIIPRMDDEDLVNVNCGVA